MADYWKSNPRKFCDVCKCWFADNRSSIEFHERGKRHQEAVKAQLADLARRGRQDYIQQQQLDRDMEQMEQAALAAFKNDLRSNPDLARQYGVKVNKKPAKVGELGPGEHGPTLDGAPLPSEIPEPAPAPEEPSKKWLEAKSDQGYSYYWNVDTGEAVWEPPEEGYVALPECAPPEPPVKKEPAVDSPAATSAPSAVKQEPDADADAPPPGETPAAGPAPRPDRPDPYGSRWEAVVKPEPPAPVDLQLPEQHQPKVQPAAPRDKARIVFRQKVVPSLGAGAGESFKKRPSEGDKKRNIRQRTDDE